MRYAIARTRASLSPSPSHGGTRPRRRHPRGERLARPVYYLSSAIRSRWASSRSGPAARASPPIRATRTSCSPRLARPGPTLTARQAGLPWRDDATMIAGGVCAYDHGSQLAQAVSFLHAHGKFVAFVTIDIGANDFPCQDSTDCLAAGFSSIGEQPAADPLGAARGGRPDDADRRRDHLRRRARRVAARTPRVRRSRSRRCRPSRPSTGSSPRSTPRRHARRGRPGRLLDVGLHAHARAGWPAVERRADLPVDMGLRARRHTARTTTPTRTDTPRSPRRSRQPCRPAEIEVHGVAAGRWSADRRPAATDPAGTPDRRRRAGGRTRWQASRGTMT